MARKRQQMIPGTEPEAIPEVTRAAEEYVDFRDERVRHLKSEIEASTELLRLMKQHKLKAYEFDGHLVTLSQLEKVTVKKKKDSKKDTYHRADG